MAADNQTERIPRLLDVNSLQLPDRPRILEVHVQPYVDTLGEDSLRV